MKTLRYIIVCMVVLFASCGEDFVNLTNPNMITTSSFWQTEDDAVLGTNALYQALIVDGTYMRKYPWTMDVRADDCYNVTPNTYVMSHLTRYTIGGEEVEQPWECNYVGIWRANQVLDNIVDIPMNETLKQRCIGEAKFIRGLCYFNLLNLYNTAVLHTKTAQSVADFYIPLSEPEVVWELVYKDFSDAVKGLWNKDQVEKGRATKAAAAAFLARSYLMNGRFSDAEPVLKAIIDGEYGTYELVPNYRDNFTDENENNIESLFELQYDLNFGSAQGWIGDPQPDWQKQDGYNKSLAPQPFGWGDIAPSLWIVNKFQEERTVDGELDLRMEAALYFPHPGDDDYLVYGYPQSKLDEMSFATTGLTALGIDDDWRFFIRKYLTEDETLDGAWKSGINRRLVRYADILLLYAECLNEANRTQDAYPFIQQVRDRANLPDLATVKPGMTQQQMREQIDHERALELCFEAWRYLDLLRWGFFKDDAKMGILKQRDPEFNNWLPGREYLAIPPTEIERTNGVVQQMPAWN